MHRKICGKNLGFHRPFVITTNLYLSIENFANLYCHKNKRLSVSIESKTINLHLKLFTQFCNILSYFCLIVIRQKVQQTI